jgi:hypothetical protein
MTILLITGAGASRNLGSEDTAMPLMSDWANALCDALDQEEANLASACHLKPGMGGPEFEENLGLLLRWEQVRHLEKRFQDLGGPKAGSHINRVVEARTHMDKRMKVVMRTVNTTLYEQFGQRQIDDNRAKAAYGALLRELDDPKLIFATINYDRSGETALESLGHRVDAGFRGGPHRTPLLQPTGLISERGSKTPVIHLHGAVGWYEDEQNGSVGNHHADLPYNPSLGTPVVLYPDPDKDPTSDAIVSELWTEFNAALEFADSVLVIGHSLHDPALVRALQPVASSKPVVVSYFEADGLAKIEAEIPGAMPVEMKFGPEIEVDKPIRTMLAASNVQHA